MFLSRLTNCNIALGAVSQTRRENQYYYKKQDKISRRRKFGKAKADKSTKQQIHLTFLPPFSQILKGAVKMDLSVEQQLARLLRK